MNQQDARRNCHLALDSVWSVALLKADGMTIGEAAQVFKAINSANRAIHKLRDTIDQTEARTESRLLDTLDTL